MFPPDSPIARAHAHGLAFDIPEAVCLTGGAYHRWLAHHGLLRDALLAFGHRVADSIGSVSPNQ